MVRTILIGVICALTSGYAFGQSKMTDIIPPSPTATSMQQYGNTNVSLYTGAVKIPIPIHTIKLKELEFSIGLNYSGSGGINIQQVASWVGTGWSLNATGAVSRTINGLADDKRNAGYMYQDTIPPLQYDIQIIEDTNGDGDVDCDDEPYSVNAISNAVVFDNFSNGMTDGEPDRFYYNVNGVSGTFYINKQKQIVETPLTNNRITPKFDLTDKLIEFQIITDRGVVYKFKEVEESRSTVLGGTSSDMDYYITSWYLTSIQNHNNTESINFHYESYEFDQYSEFCSTLDSQNAGNVFVPRYSVSETHAQRLKYITYNASDTIKFITGAATRKDLWEEKFLASIEIHEQGINRSVDFTYSYFDKNGVEPLNTTAVASHSFVQGSLINTMNDGDHFKRLKLDAVRFFNDDRSQSLPYTFEYYSGAYLPSRFSYARDHWGFYNGKETNTSLEIRQKIDRRVIHSAFREGYDFEIAGNADREPSAVHANAGMLTKIYYPTGGATEFEYELHQSAMKELPNNKDHTGASLSPLVLKDTIHLETINDAFIDLKILVIGIVLGPSCDIMVTLKNLQTSEVMLITDFKEGSKTKYLLEGDYEISYTEMDGIGNCFEDFYNVKFQWTNELVTPNKNVGGLRIKRTTDITDGGYSVTRVYNYVLEDTTLSSGSLASIPRYGFYGHDGSVYSEGTVHTGFATTIVNNGIIMNYTRTYNTNMPLVLTQGSHVGYRRVEVTTHAPDKSGKTVYYYTCPADYPDFMKGWTIFKYDQEVTINGRKEPTFLYPHTDDRDWKRGLLYAQVEYAYVGGEFVRISSKESHYKIYGEVDVSYDFNWKVRHPLQFRDPVSDYSKDKFFLEDETEGAGIPKLQGVRTLCVGDGCGKTYVTNYEYYSGRIELVSQVENQYKDQDVLSSVSMYSYNSPGYYYPTKVQTTTSLTDSLTTLTKYTFDHAAISGLSSGQTIALDSLLSRNVLAPVETITKRGSTELEHKRTNYSADGDHIYPQNIVSSGAGGALETDVEFTAYDADGNLLEYIARNGVPTSFLYSYENKLPVAQAVNARHTQIFYNSFEEDGTVGESKTGQRYHTGDYTFNLSTAQANSVLSYWYWDSNTWKFKQVSYSGGSHTITDGTRIDEVRVHPAGTVMTTYTYAPGIGITSVTDPNHKTMYYTYDSFRRLMLVKDHSGNILQRTQYNYKGQE